jgi:glutathionyl-hydroquinone reductase
MWHHHPGFATLPLTYILYCSYVWTPLLLQAAPARLHVYVGNACPWCHRVLLAVALLGLGGRVGITHLQVGGGGTGYGGRGGCTA